MPFGELGAGQAGVAEVGFFENVHDRNPGRLEDDVEAEA